MHFSKPIRLVLCGTLIWATPGLGAYQALAQTKAFDVQGENIGNTNTPIRLGQDLDLSGVSFIQGPTRNFTFALGKSWTTSSTPIRPAALQNQHTAAVALHQTAQKLAAPGSPERTLRELYESPAKFADTPEAVQSDGGGSSGTNGLESAPNSLEQNPGGIGPGSSSTPPTPPSDRGSVPKRSFPGWIARWGPWAIPIALAIGAGATLFLHHPFVSYVLAGTVPISVGGVVWFRHIRSKQASATNEPSVAAPTAKTVKEEDSPLNKKILLLQANKEPEKILAAASAVLGDPSETRFEARVSALRILDSHSQQSPVFISPNLAATVWTQALLEDPDLGIRRQAALLLGQRAKEISSTRQAVIDALVQASKSGDGSLQLMADWALTQFSVDPKEKTGASKIIASLRESARAKPVVPAAPKKWYSRWYMKALGVVALIGLGYGTILMLDRYVPPASQNGPPGIVQPYYSPVNPQAPALPQGSFEVRPAPVANGQKAAQPQSDLTEIKRDIHSAAEELHDLTNEIGLFFAIFTIVIPVLGALVYYLSIRTSTGGRKTGTPKQKVQSGDFSKIGSVTLKFEKPTTTFKEVVGIDNAKLQIRELADSISGKSDLDHIGKVTAPKGVLLVGPPGGGKTLLARALAGETNVRFMYFNGADFAEMFVGVGPGRMRSLFEEAKTNAPCIIFIDEIDAVGRKRGGSTNEERDATLNSLLVGMDGFDSIPGVTLIAATNHPEILDPALLQRFDRHILVGAPDPLGREAILQHHALKRRALLGPDADLNAVARVASGLTGRSLEHIIEESIRLARRRIKWWRRAANRLLGLEDCQEYITMKDLNEAYTKEVMGGEGKDLIIQPEIKEVFGVHEKGHVFGGILAGLGIPYQVTAISRGQAGGFTQWAMDESEMLLGHQKKFEAYLQMILSGRAAEELVYGYPSTGASNDLERANQIVRDMIEVYGFSSTLGLLVRLRDPSNPTGKASFSETTEREIELEMKRRLDNLYVVTLAALRPFKELLKQSGITLAQKEIQLEDEIRQEAAPVIAAASSDQSPKP